MLVDLLFGRASRVLLVMIGGSREVVGGCSCRSQCCCLCCSSRPSWHSMHKGAWGRALRRRILMFPLPRQRWWPTAHLPKFPLLRRSKAALIDTHHISLCHCLFFLFENCGLWRAIALRRMVALICKGHWYTFFQMCIDVFFRNKITPVYLLY